MELLNPNLDINKLSEEYRSTGQLFIPDFLNDDIADQIYTCLEKGIPWEFVYKGKGAKPSFVIHSELQKLDARDRMKLIPKVPKRLSDFAFAYNRYEIPSLENTLGQPNEILSTVAEFFNSDKYIKLMRDITGIDYGRYVNTCASRYDPRHYLTVHTDTSEDDPQGRIAAHVISLTKGWDKSWGGRFTFCDAKGKAQEQRIPGFNTLALFQVPRNHRVTQVKEYAKAYRYSLFGWYKKNPG